MVLFETALHDSASQTSHGDAEWPTRNVAIGVAKTLARVRAQVPGLTAGSLAIIESLLFCFMSAFPSRQNERERGRFLQSMFHTAGSMRLIQDNETNAEQDLTKYWANVYMLRCLRVPKLNQIEAEWPKTCGAEVTPLFHGWVRRFILRRVAKRDVSFIYSLVQCKRMWKPISSYRIFLALEKHKKALGTKCVTPKPDIVWAVIGAKNSVLSDHHGNYNYAVGFSMAFAGERFCPSISACLQARVQDGGALSLFPRYVAPDSKDDPRVDLRILCDSWNRWRFQTYDRAVVGARRSWNKNGGTYKVRIAKVLEPSKVRILSVGDGYLYSALQPLQGHLLNAVAETSWSPLRQETDDIIDRLRVDLRTFLSEDYCDKESALRGSRGGWWWRDEEYEQKKLILSSLGKEEFYWFSGDFSAATDNLNGKLSKAVLRGLPSGGLVGVAESFCSNRMVYPAAKHVRDGKLVVTPATEVKQRNGQLMGHVLSFPVLCIVNLGVYRAAVVRYMGILRKEFEESISVDRFGTYDEASVRTEEFRCELRRELFGRYLDVLEHFMANTVTIQGDDILFPAPLRFFSVWEGACREAGLFVSPGKNYVSRTHACFCSRVYDLSGESSRRIGYLNLKLVTGINVKGGGESKATPVALGRELNAMVALAPWTRCAIPHAFSRFKKDFKSWFVPNWYIPVHLGGFGVSLSLAPENWRVTEQQRLLAAMFVADQKLALYWTRGIKFSLDSFESRFVTVALVPDPSIGHFCDIDLNTPSSAAPDVLSDPWMERFCSIKLTVTGQPADEDLMQRAARIKPDYRLKPMSDIGFARYWVPNYSGMPMGAPPPLGKLGDRDSYMDQKTSEERVARSISNHDFVRQEMKQAHEELAFLATEFGELYELAERTFRP